MSYQTFPTPKQQQPTSTSQGSTSPKSSSPVKQSSTETISAFDAAVEMGRALFTSVLVGHSIALNDEFKSGRLTKEDVTRIQKVTGDNLAGLLAGQTVSGVSLNDLGRFDRLVKEGIALSTLLFVTGKEHPELISKAWAEATNPAPWQYDEGSNIEG